ncbi:MAG TPA: response regulator transcription factor [Elusimicrobiota bacterium]|nr:response regulator transcription factor [Elusimicrobiota bacterium]
MTEKILIVDDDPEIRDFLEQVFRKEGFQVQTAETGERGLDMIHAQLFDLLILDLNLPGLGGMTLCEILKQDPSTAELPVIMLTANTASRTKVQGLETGADDYVTKPPQPAEMVARVRALLRRVQHQGRTERVIEAGGLVLNDSRHELTVGGQRVDLRPKEFELLKLLLEKKDRTLDRPYLKSRLWSEEREVTDHNLDVLVNQLRKQLGPSARCVETVPSVGYRFTEHP